MAQTRLSRKEIEQIVGLLTSWNGKLTWGALTDRVQALLRRPFTRQGLDKQPSIALAFKQAKTRLRTKRTLAGPSSDRPLEMTTALNRIDNLLAEVKVLQAEKNSFLERFARWTYNARSRGLTLEDLNRPLPPIDRRSSEKR